MRADERRALLGAATVDAVRADALRAAEEYPPGPEVIAALRPILTAQQRKTKAKQKISTPVPLAA